MLITVKLCFDRVKYFSTFWRKLVWQDKSPCITMECAVGDKRKRVEVYRTSVLQSSRTLPVSIWMTVVNVSVQKVWLYKTLPSQCWNLALRWPMRVPCLPMMTEHLRPWYRVMALGECYMYEFLVTDVRASVSANKLTNDSKRMRYKDKWAPVVHPKIHFEWFFDMLNSVHR